MKVALFSDCYLPAVNGVVTSICQQLEALRGLGHEVDLYCPRYGSEVSEEGIYRLWARPFPFHKREQMTLPWPPSVLKRALQVDYDIFHIQTPFSVGLLGLFISFARRIPRVFHHHTLWEEYVDYLPIPREVSSRGSVLLCRTLANRCQAVVAPSGEVKERFQAQGVEVPVSVIPTGIRPSLFQNGSVLPEKGQDEEVVLYVGRLAFEKSLDSLMRVFSRIHERRPQARLWLVGDGPAREALESQASELGLSEACRFFGFVPRDTLRDFMASARLFLFCSHTETQGLVLLEAQAGGLPVTAFRASGVSEAVDDGVTGFLVEDGEEEFLAEKSLKLLSDTALWSRFSEACRGWASLFSVEQMGCSLLEVYEQAQK